MIDRDNHKVKMQNNVKIMGEKDSLLLGMLTYSGECDTHHNSGKEHHEELKVVRLAVLGEAIKGQMDDDQWHRQADSEIGDL